MSNLVLKTSLFLILIVTKSCLGSPLPEEDPSASGMGKREEVEPATAEQRIHQHRAPDPTIRCPAECTCEDAPLKAAPFVLTWMTSWGEDDLPQLHPNDVMETEDFVVSSTATDAELDVEVRGLHATCALMQETNITLLIQALPTRIMVLSIMQAFTKNIVYIESGDLSPLQQLTAIHIQGFAKKESTQMSGFFSNRVLEMVEHKEELNKIKDEEQDLLLALSEDALAPLTNLKLLDLQYVRLVAALEGGRLRRQTKPVSTTTFIDLPLQEFFSLADQIRGLDLPPEIMSKLPVMPPINQLRADIELALLDEEEEINVVSYDVFKSESDVILAPFTSQKQLKYLRVAHAKLDRVGQELLSGLQNLHTLTLEYNHIKVLPAAMFTPTPHLRHLSLAHNNIITIEGNTLSGLDNLLTLDLDHNSLDRLGPGSFPSLPNLATLRLLNNPLTHVFPFTFANINSTEVLLLGSREVSVELHTDTFRKLSSLKVLQIENTTFLSLSRDFLEGMPQLKELKIHGKMPSVDFDAFTATPSLESLDMSYCHLSWLSLDAFFGLNHLKYLDLSHNNIDELAPGTFDHLSNLRELYLHHNNLTTLPIGIFIPLPAKLIQLHQNPWHCTCDLLQLKPTITNKVRRPSYTTCRWEETRGTICTNEEPVPVRYDTRVAPLCASPLQHSYFDVFHVTTRRLKCPKHLYDPTPIPQIDIFEDHKEEELEVVKVVEDEPNWLPLTAFAPPPVPGKDHWAFMVAEMPEETYAPLTEEDLEEIEREQEEREKMERELEETEEMRRENWGHIFRSYQRDEAEEEGVEEDISNATLTNISERPQTDDAIAYLKSFEKDAMQAQMKQYQLQKPKEKARLEAEHQMKLKEKQAHKMETHRRRLAEEKKRIKLQMEEEKKLRREKKALELQEFLKQHNRFLQ